MSDQIPRPTHQLGEGFPQTDWPFWKSAALMRNLPSLKSYCRGTYFFSPRRNFCALTFRTCDQ